MEHFLIEIAEGMTIWCFIGLCCSLDSEPLWFHHLTGKFDWKSALLIVALGPISIMGYLIAWFGMRNIDKDQPKK